MPNFIQWFFASLGAIVSLNVVYICLKAIAVGMYAHSVNKRAREVIARAGLDSESKKALLAFYKWTTVFVFMMALPLPFSPIYEIRLRNELRKISERASPPKSD